MTVARGTGRVPLTRRQKVNIPVTSLKFSAQEYQCHKKRQGSNGRNSFIICDKKIKEFAKRKAAVTDEVNNCETYDRAH
jgi:hypothetical protein